MDTVSTVRTKRVANCPGSGPESSQLLSGLKGPLPPWIGADRVQVQSSSVVQAVLDLEVRVRVSRDWFNMDPFTLDDPSFRFSRNTVSLRRHVERMVRWGWARFGRVSALDSWVPLLLSAFVGPNSYRDATPRDGLPFEHSYCVDKCRAKKRQRIAQADAR
jgi:hypothetical protein